MEQVSVLTDRAAILKGRLSMAISSLLVLLAVGSVYISQLIFQEIATSFNVAALDARFAFSLTSITYALSFFLFGPLSDRIPTKKMSVLGGGGVVAALLVTCLSEEFSVFLFAIAMAGVFAAAVPAAMFAYTARTSSVENLAGTMGVMIAASVVGIIIGRSFVALITENIGWQFAFACYACLMILAILAIRMLPDEPMRQDSRLPLYQLYGKAIGLFFQMNTLRLFTLGFSLFFGYLGISSFMTFALKQPPFNLNGESLGWLNMVGLSALAGPFLATRLNRRISSQLLASVFLAGTIAAITMIGYSTTLIFVAVGIVFLFIMVFATQSLVLAMLNSRVPADQKGTASSLYLLSSLAGGGIATSVLGNVWSAYGWAGTIVACQLAAAVSLILMLLEYRWKG